MPLKISGFEIGVIDDIVLRDDASVYITFSVNEKDVKWITKDSILMIIKPLIGSAHIDVYPSLGSKVLKSGSQLTLIQNNSIDEMLSKLEPAVDNITKILENINYITNYIVKEDSDLMQSMKNINILTKKLSTNPILTSITGDKKSTKNIIKSLNETTKIMKDVHSLTSSLNTQIISPSSDLIKELNFIMKDVKQKLDALDSTVKVIGKYDGDLVMIKEQIVAGVQKSNEIMTKIDSLMQDDESSEIVLP